MTALAGLVALLDQGVAAGRVPADWRSLTLADALALARGLAAETVEVAELPAEAEAALTALTARRRGGHQAGCGCHDCVADRATLTRYEALDLAEKEA